MMKLMLSRHGGSWFLRVTNGDPVWLESGEWSTANPTKESHLPVSDEFVHSVAFVMPANDECLVVNIDDPTIKVCTPPAYYVRETLEKVEVVHRASGIVEWERPSRKKTFYCRECDLMRTVSVGVHQDDRIAARIHCEGMNRA
jgi:hypothetical protein